nr:excalibur calcium-binding domain-containing protein [Actinacidiphila oryziradicis]
MPSASGAGSASASASAYANCAAARKAGAAPLHRGDPGYSTKLDRDGDGVACDS